VRARRAPDPDVQFGVAPEQLTTECSNSARSSSARRAPSSTPSCEFLIAHAHHGALGWFLDALGFTTLNRAALRAELKQLKDEEGAG
jgi:hypothetical protein